MALLQAVSKRVLEAEAQEPRARCWTTRSSPSTARGSTSSRSTCRTSTRAHVLEATGLHHRGDRRAGRPLPQGRPGHHHLGDGPDPAQEGRGHHQGDHQPAAAARQHRQARRRRLPDPRAQQRAGRPDHGHLGADAAGLPGRPRARSSASTRRANTAPTPSRPSAGCATARSRSSSPSAATWWRPSPTPPPRRRRCKTPR